MQISHQEKCWRKSKSECTTKLAALNVWPREVGAARGAAELEVALQKTLNTAPNSNNNRDWYPAALEKAVKAQQMSADCSTRENILTRNKPDEWESSSMTGKLQQMMKCKQRHKKASARAVNPAIHHLDRCEAVSAAVV